MCGARTQSTAAAGRDNDSIVTDKVNPIASAVIINFFVTVMGEYVVIIIASVEYAIVLAQ